MRGELPRFPSRHRAARTARTEPVKVSAGTEDRGAAEGVGRAVAGTEGREAAAGADGCSV